MSLIQDVSPEELAKLFHHYQDALAGDFECKPGKECAPSWEQTPQNERKLKIAAVRLALLELAATSAQDRPSREYYAKPGQAEWGC
ncbi:MAG: hypothetical protein LAN83_10290 [Acidobacteriia bacterium]|nr:hypothetical protein [Terriglobia bacterium]